MGAVVKLKSKVSVPSTYRADTRQQGMELTDMFNAFYYSRRMGLHGARGPAREKTLVAYGKVFSQFETFLRDRDIKYWSQVTESDMASWFEGIQKRDNIQQATKAFMFRHVRALLKWVSKSPECRSQKMEAFLETIPVIRKSAPKSWIPSPEEMMTFLKQFDQRFIWDFRDFVVTQLLLDTGMRIGEVCHLTAEHIKWDSRVVLVPAAGKTGSRPVPVNAEVTVPLLRQWIRMREAIAKTDWLFVSKFGGQCVDNTFDQSYRRNRIRAGIDGQLSPHTVRHYFATHYLVNGGPIQNLKAILGHTSYNTLQLYINLAATLTTVSADHSKYSPAKSLSNDLNASKRRMVRNGVKR